MRVIQWIMMESVFGLFFLAKKRNTKVVVMWQNFSLIATEDRKIIGKEQGKWMC